MLDEDQARCALSEESVIVTAGPGSGKTRTIISRIEHLMKNNISPTEILAFTFTKHAANEMKERISHKGYNADALTITTIHGFCFHLIRNNAYILKRDPNIIVYDDQDSNDLIRIICETGNLPFKKKDIKKSEYWKDIEPTYNRMLKDFNGIIFDQMHEMAIAMLKSGKIDHIKKRYRYLILDEMQDISSKDLELIGLLREFHKHLFACGDVLQCIYQFRGADPSLIKELNDICPSIAVDLDKTYRCPPEVCDVIEKFSGKSLESIKPKGSSEVLIKKFQSESSEHSWIVQKIKNSDSDDIAVICRTNKQINSLSILLDSNDMEFHKMGKHVDLMNIPTSREINSFIKTKVNPNDFLNFFKCARVLVPKLSNRDLHRMLSESRISRRSLVRVASEKHDMSIFDLDRDSFIKEVTSVMHNAYSKTLRTTKSNHVLIYSEFILNWLTENNVKELEDYTHYISEASVSDDAENVIKENRIKLITVHGSKGLEFDTVFMPGLNKHLYRKGDENVVFVGASRSMRNLYMSCHRVYLRHNFTQAYAEVAECVECIF